MTAIIYQFQKPDDQHRGPFAWIELPGISFYMLYPRVADMGNDLAAIYDRSVSWTGEPLDLFREVHQLAVKPRDQWTRADRDRVALLAMVVDYKCWGESVIGSVPYVDPEVWPVNKKPHGD